MNQDYSSATRATRRKLRLRWSGWAATLLLAACGQAVTKLAALEPDSNAACALDGMVLKDFPSSKAQIRYEDGKTDYFCDVMELFSMVLMPDQRRPVAGLYVQDMARAVWDRPMGHWIPAQHAWYVAGSRRAGSMGPTIVPFGTAETARAFAAAEGGRVLRFDQVDSSQLRMAGAGAHGMDHGAAH
ncbi:nitrous oxide reductase accessory protein NosL [Pseudoduganella aquatica]|uniref:Nitrous oxide reductase accessory protein NosL n=1 Tax=Pseudoduganella aquatica TaxID=2660641 RepID=A0A7X4KQD2_9BURK|nr:nitrous oxide reductase accessory protein NosL [Pseudoduganella aquatica]MYN10166.1 nitrous oxide reductase accessory protein NosL [Pseudoduganella aquatica]